MISKTSENSITLTLLTVGVIAVGVVAVAIAAARQALIAEHAWMMMIALALLVSPNQQRSHPGVKADVVLGDVVTFSVRCCLVRVRELLPPLPTERLHP